MAVHVYIALSLDGFIARPDGSLDWLTSIPNPGGSDYGYGKFMARMDAVVMGRKTFQTVLGFGDWPYAKPVFVLSHSLKTLPKALEGQAFLLEGRPAELVARLKAQGYTELYIDGGQTIQAFLEEDLVDELTLTTVATILGEGLPLFGRMGRSLDLVLDKAEALGDRLAQCHYTRRPAPGPK